MTATCHHTLADEDNMALLQISEPVQSPQSQARKRAVGIDLGTTNSLVASVIDGRAQTLVDSQGNTLSMDSP